MLTPGYHKHNDTLTKIDLTGNEIRTSGGTEISDYLARNTSLEKLCLDKNHLNHDDFVLIARALKQNHNLRHIHLGNMAAGRKALSKAVYDDGSLNAMSDTNHSCTIEGIGYFNITNHRDADVRENRRSKIYSLLSSRNTEGNNVHHFQLELSDDSLKLAPKVLECVHRYSQNRWRDTVNPLSITYEVLRGWHMPTLYEGRSAP